MNVLQRNFFRLIRAGSFGHDEQVEPMSYFKWEKLFQLSLFHNVQDAIYQGMQRCRDQFSFDVNKEQWAKWRKTIQESQTKPEPTSEESDLLRGDRLTNPVLNGKLQDILDDEQTDTCTRLLLLTIIRIARCILNEGLPLQHLIELGLHLRQQYNKTNFLTLQQWLRSLHAEQIAVLEGTLLVQLFNFDIEEIPFLKGKTDKNAEQVARELTDFESTRIQDFYFSQEADSIFVHSSNGTALVDHIKRTARYFHYYPSETITNFFASFAHSLSHIQE